MKLTRGAALILSFYKKYILLNLNEYDSFGGFDFYVTVFLWLLTAGLCAGIFLANYKKNKMIRLTKKLLRHGAKSEENAKTLAEIGLEAKKYKSLLSIGSRLSRIIKTAGVKDLTYEEYVALEKAKKQSKKSAPITAPEDVITTPAQENNSNTVLLENESAAASDVQTPTADENTATSESNAQATPESKTASCHCLKPFDEAKLYIPAETESAALDLTKRGESTPLQSALASVFCVCISACLTFLLPVILEFLDGVLSK